MKITIIFTEKDVERILAEHCRKKFGIDPHNVEIKQVEPDVFTGRVEGDYQPEQ